MGAAFAWPFPMLVQ